MNLIQLDSSVNYLDIIYPPDMIRSVRYSQIKEVSYKPNGEAVILVISNDDSIELKYTNVEDPGNPGNPFLTPLDLLLYIGTLLNLPVGSIYDIYYQRVVFDTIINIDGEWYYKDSTTNGNNIKILNTQIATFDGTAYLQSDYDLDLWGITITEFTGTSTPTINGFNINFTAGTFEYMKLSNGDEYYAQAGGGVTLYSNGKIHNLFTRVAGAGTITPETGVYDDGDIVTITATPTDPETTELDRIEKTDDEGTTEIANNSVLTILKTNSIVAYFIHIYTIIQNFNFANLPTKIGKNWYYKNELDTQDIKNVNIVCVVDSITLGAACGGIPYPEILHAELQSYFQEISVFNQGVGSRTTQEAIEAYTTEFEPLYDSDKDNYFIILSGANDDLTVLQSYNKIIELAALATATGFKIITISQTGSTNTIINERLIALRTYLEANPIGEYTLNVSEIPQALDPSDTTYFCDGLHWTEALRDLIVSKMVYEYWDNELIATPTLTDIKINNTDYLNSTSANFNVPITTPGTNDFTLRYEFYGIPAGDGLILLNIGTTTNYLNMQINSSSTALLLRLVDSAGDQLINYVFYPNENDHNFIQWERISDKIIISTNKWRRIYDIPIDTIIDGTLQYNSSAGNISDNLIKLTYTDTQLNNNCELLFADSHGAYLQDTNNNHVVTLAGTYSWLKKDDIRPALLFDEFEKVYTNETYGSANVTSNANSGEFIIKLNMATLNTTYWYLFHDNIIENVGDNANGYYLRQNAGGLRIYRMTGGAGVVINARFDTLNLQVNTDYEFKVVVSEAGVFTTYGKGGTLGTEFVQLTASAGTNPFTDTTHTTANYMTILTPIIRISDITIDGISKIQSFTDINGGWGFANKINSQTQNGYVDSGNTLSGIKYSDWEEKEKTHTELYEETESETYIPTKTANAITQLIIKQ